MRITTKSTLLAAAMALSLTGTTAFAQQAKTGIQVGANATTPAVPAVPATPAIPATPALPTVDGVTRSIPAEPAKPAEPASPAVRVDGNNASQDPTAVARDHQSHHAVDGQAVSTDAKVEAEVKQDAKTDAQAAKKVAKKKKKPF